MDIKREYRWGTNKPVLKAIMDVFSPQHTLELGIGRNSTPLLYGYGKKLTCIETDKQWIDIIREELPERENFKIIFHNVGVHFKRTYKEVDENIKKSAVEFYKKHLQEDMDFLFIDHAASLRCDALLSLFSYFKIIAYHDAEEKVYNYEKLTDDMILDYFKIFSTPPLVYTGVLIHKSLKDKVKIFIRKLREYNAEYCKLYNMQYNNLVSILKIVSH